MKSQANGPTVMEGIGVALVGALTGAGAFAMLSVILDSLGLFRLLIAGLAMSYVVYLLVRSGERVGRLSVMGIWIVLAGVNFVLVDSPLWYLVAHLAVIWLVRSLYYYHGILPALMDLALMGLALLASIWASYTTHSMFLSLWCFFLVQALFALIPSSLTLPRGKAVPAAARPDDFERAHRAAQVALRKLTTSH